MARFDLLLLDSVIVIQLHALGLWQQIVNLCDVHLTRSIVDEALYFVDGNGDKRNIDLSSDEVARRIVVHDPPASETAALCGNFGPDILEKLDPGELDALTVLYSSLDGYVVCSADKIVYRVLGALRLSDQGISLQEVLSKVGLTHDLPEMYTKSYREYWSRRGFEDGIKGLSSLGRQDT